MKHNEIRIDNWVRWNGPSHKEDARIISMSKEEVMFACGDTATYNELRPIKLTKKLLKHIGFDCFGKDWEGVDRYELHLMKIEIRGKEFYEFQTGTYLKSLHQLQNVYYSLHENDLKINLK